MSIPAKRIEGLDGLRALACLAVFGVHFQQITGITGQIGPLNVEQFLLNGNTGVALFFALSGFLLSLPFWRGELDTPNRPWLMRYISSRVVRILPAYYLCLAGLVIFKQHWTSGSDLLDTLSHFLFLHNYGERTFYSISAPFWAIGIQVQFYMVLPFLFWFLQRATSKKSSAVVVTLALSVGCYLLHYFVMEQGNQIGAMFGMSNLVESRPNVVSHSILAHLPHLLWGVLAAAAYQKLLATKATPRKTVTCEVTVWVCGLAILAIVATSLDDVLQSPHGRYNFPYIPALIATIIACTPLTKAARWLLESFPLRRLGEISYGIYVFHLPCMKLVERTSPRLGFDVKENWLLFVAISLAVSIGVATASYLLLERPLLRILRRRNSK